MNPEPVIPAAEPAARPPTPSGWVYEGSRRRPAELANNPASLPENAADGAHHHPVRPPASPVRLMYNGQLRELSEQMRAGGIPLTDAAAVTDQVLHPETGLLAHLADILEAVAKRLCETGTDDAFDFYDGIVDTTNRLHRIADDLRPISDMVRDLSPSPKQRPAAAPSHIPPPTSPRPVTRPR
ncbi:hypothetical protein ACIBCM_32135 [Streptomyces sp. NPDC051018]|uniref:hypothetical protein n=1 Tax=Streptomyces sp. NPDC051018 TaxID=3365639 RepID=UPI0037B43E52